MYKVSLINPPFAAITLPSLALMQLKVATEQDCGGDACVRILHVSHDFARHIGRDLYTSLCATVDVNMCGLGEWFFRPSVFPNAPDNEEEYFARFFSVDTSGISDQRQLIRDARRDWTKFLPTIIEKYDLDDDDLVGFTSMFCQNMASFAMARELKRRNPKLVTVMGGANCESPMGEAIAHHIGDIDFVCSGPSLRSFPELVRSLHCADTEARDSIGGVFSRRNVTACVKPGQPLKLTSSVATLGADVHVEREWTLDYTPFLDSLDASFGLGEVKADLLFETSRGCWWGERAHCTFCGLNTLTMGFRAMSPEQATRQFEHLFAYADRCSRLSCVDNIMPREYLTEVFPNLRPPANLSIFYEVKADLTHEELRVLADANVKYLQPGVEALATSTLRLMKKGTSAFSNIEFLKNCRRVAISAGWNLLVGFPGETEDVFRKYIDDMRRIVHLQPPTGVYPVRFDRYSPYFDRATEYGLDLHASEWYGYVYPFDDAVLDQIAYYFTDYDFGALYLHAMARHLRAMRQGVSEWKAAWNRSGGAGPELTINTESGRSFISDSRFSSMQQHTVDDEHLAFLRHLSSPRRREKLRDKFGSDAGYLLEWCHERNLLFEEDGRVMSLAIEPDGGRANDCVRPQATNVKLVESSAASVEGAR